MEAVEGRLRVMNNMRFTLSRRVIALCSSQLKAAVAAYGGGGGVSLPLRGVHKEVPVCVCVCGVCVCV